MAWSQGNQYGRMGAPVTNALRRAAMENNGELLIRACRKALVEASKGSLSHLAWVADRLDGKSIARIEHVDSDTRELDLASIMRLVMQARSAAAEDVQAITSDTPTGIPDST